MLSYSSSSDKYASNSHFDRCLRQIEQDILRMGALVEQSFRLSHEALFDQNIEVTKQINALDEQIDQYYRQIELDCVTLMTLKAPFARDLRLICAYMQLIRDIERIGDYAEDLAEFALKLFPYSSHECLPEVAAMSQQTQMMLAASLGALSDLDDTAGRRVKEMDDTVDEAYEHLYITLAKETDVKGSVEPILLLGLVIRHLERMADHATNIGQRVSYIVTGDRA
ncbi:MAG: phosphate signaling complex protein PhoU [Halothece sp.]